MIICIKSIYPPEISSLSSNDYFTDSIKILKFPRPIHQQLQSFFSTPFCNNQSQTHSPFKNPPSPNQHPTTSLNLFQRLVPTPRQPPSPLSPSPITPQNLLDTPRPLPHTPRPPPCKKNTRGTDSSSAGKQDAARRCAPPFQCRASFSRRAPC